MRSTSAGSTLLALCLYGSVSLATVFGSVRGVVHDPEHRPIAGATVVVKSATSQFEQTTSTDDNGAFAFSSIPVGQYTISVSHAGFQPEQQAVFLNSGSAPVLHFPLLLGPVHEEVEV